MTAWPAVGPRPVAARSVDWLASRAGNRVFGDVVGWALASVLAIGLFTASVALSLWVSRLDGADGARQTTVLIDLPPLPPAIATTEAAPDVPATDLPENLDQIVEDTTQPDLPEPEITTTPEMPPQTPLPDQVEIPVEVDRAAVPLPPPPPPKVEQKPKQQPKAKAQVKKPAEPKKTRTRAAKPSQEQAPRNAGASKGQVKSAKAKWGAAIRKKVERRKSYPKSAGGAAGTAKVRLTVARSGALVGVSLVGSSGNAALDSAAVSAVQKAGGFAAAPAELTDAQYTFNLPINFSK